MVAPAHSSQTYVAGGVRCGAAHGAVAAASPAALANASDVVLLCVVDDRPGARARREHSSVAHSPRIDCW